jgi:hypothetical protein
VTDSVVPTLCLYSSASIVFDWPSINCCTSRNDRVCATKQSGLQFLPIQSAPRDVALFQWERPQLPLRQWSGSVSDCQFTMFGVLTKLCPKSRNLNDSPLYAYLLWTSISVLSCKHTDPPHSTFSISYLPVPLRQLFHTADVVAPSTACFSSRLQLHGRYRVPGFAKSRHDAIGAGCPGTRWLPGCPRV